MSYKFPDNYNQKFKKRKCFHCKKLIDIADYLVTNKSIYNTERLIELWENDKLEFFCCLCYDNLIQNMKISRLRNGLNDDQQDILRIIEKKCRIDIPVVSQINYDSIGLVINNGKMTGLSLFKCLNLFPKEITMVNSLENLNLAWNSLNKLPKSIKNLKNLKELNLSGNNLISIPEEIGHLKFLVNIDLSFNEIDLIPETITQLPSLNTLNLIHNNIKKIPESIKLLEVKGLKLLL